MLETIRFLLSADDDRSQRAAGVLIHLIGVVRNLSMELRRIRRKFPVSSPPVKEEPNSDPDIEYDVESIIGHTYVDGRLFMLVKWVGYDDPTYERVENLSCPETIAEYWATTGSSDGKFILA